MGSASRLYRTGDDGGATQMAANAALDAAKQNPTAAKYIDKAETIASDTAAGCTAGPYGCVAGAVVGVVQAFGGDVVDALNPPDFRQTDYDRMAGFCVNGGAANNAPRGTIVPGIPADQYGACRYTDWVGDSFSGGDAPFPGSWNVGRDGAYIKDQDAFDRWHGPLCGGVPLPPGLVCVGDRAYRIDQLCGGQPLPAGMICSNGKPITAAQQAAQAKAATMLRSVLSKSTNVAAILGAKKALPTLTASAAPPKIPPATLARISTNAHTIVALATSGNATAQAAVGDIAMKASIGDPVAQVQAAILTQAAKLQIRAKYITRFVYGGRTSTGAAPCCANCH